MNTQYLQYVREQLMVATADLSGETKGQLLAWLENAQFDTKNYPRKKQRIWDKETERWITLNNPPIPGKQPLAKGCAIPLVKPVEYSTASWRRAVLSLDEHYKAWLLWNYSENTCWEHQVEITQWAWEQFSQKLEGKRVAKKTIDRLRQLIWLAAQDVKAELAGRDVYQYGELAALVGVNKTNWSQNYVEHYDAMVSLYKGLDSQALLHVSRSRSQQKTANYQQGIAEMN
ncbi:antiterminator [Salmonella enterica]|nr:antiterminator [Salmonella enterica]EBF2684938.1 antiterminator [Salmonella enterica subsp. enterica serovar Senftenberg]ECZ2101385.1 antiterminator [Salmonella enterica subsp. enterica serovar Give]EDT6864928.1 antiterminator [Salmonella enterica subsp. enterica serovar Meleagridis]EDU9038154.1 antiterminator [Salmonella enterica subsp. enterica]EJR1452990.1 antiterminator [Salmonella enterica subsp. enterica serovar Muenster]HCZ3806096.1 antiterminator [Salmonella enterica subsp. enteric